MPSQTRQKISLSGNLEKIQKKLFKLSQIFSANLLGVSSYFRQSCRKLRQHFAFCSQKRKQPEKLPVLLLLYRMALANPNTSLIVS